MDLMGDFDFIADFGEDFGFITDFEGDFGFITDFEGDFGFIADFEGDFGLVGFVDFLTINLGGLTDDLELMESFLFLFFLSNICNTCSFVILYTPAFTRDLPFSFKR